ncbi:cytochrome P450 71A9-like [Iris pallida]|uniref:Cytochrome P450 71A9-like n=1 Tax=Iris pallida TaxID=29817 RepID=A0AAX6IAK7_IRIPA|nr:cytochrome P450 71A9-like [Iris pallida]
MAREVFEAHDLAFSGRPPLYAARKLSYGFLDVAFAPYGEHWRQARKTCVLELLSLKRVRSFRAVREGAVASLVATIERQSGTATINLSRLVHSLGSSVMRRVVFGDERAGRGRRGGELRDVLEETQKLLGGFCVADFFPWLGWCNWVTGLERRLRKNFEELDGIYSQVIDEHLNDMSAAAASGRPPAYDEDLVHVLLRLQKDHTHGSTFSSMDHIKALLTDMFIAGTDTSSAAIIWTMTELVRNPTVMNKAQQEIRTVVGDKPTVEESELELLDYLKLVVKEALRLHPPAPLLVPRETTGACSVGGYDVPAKTRVFINAAAIATDPTNWEKPTEFRPERFLGSGIDFRGHNFELIPFGFGRRSCPGMNFAVLQVELILANLLHCFDWELPIGMAAKDLDLDEAFGLTVHKKNDLCLLAKSR